MGTFQYIPRSLAAEVQSMPVNHICIEAQPAGLASPSSTNGPKTNHWVMYFTNGNEQTSLRLDPSPSGTEGFLIAIVSRVPQSKDAAKSYTLTPISNITFGDVIDTIVSKKHDKYQFSESGQGCRFWIDTVLKQLHEDGTLDSHELRAVSDGLKMVWGLDGQALSDFEQSPITRGKFFF